MTEIKAAEMLKAYYVCQQMQVKGIYENVIAISVMIAICVINKATTVNELRVPK